ncbi:MAG TPA: SIMPL domain-containing protein [Arenimonas sp.]|nr:SIMPL domain-containing protein [Arenimonas sp.]
MRLFASIFLAVLSASVFAQTIPNVPHIIVKGMAESKAVPDTFRADFMIKKISFNVQEATLDVEQNTALLIDSAKRLGVKQEDLKALNIQIGPINEYNETKRKNEFSGNQVSRSLNVKFTDKKTFQKFLSSIPSSQSIQLNSVRGTLSTYKTLESALFKQAVSDAKNQALFMSDTFGLNLLGIYTVTSNDPSIANRSLDNVVVSGNRIGAPVPPAPPPDSFGGLGNVLEEGELNFMKSVYIVYLVQDKNAKLPRLPAAE